ncbi:MAG: hypothetical protein WDW38_001011 [Sanguina aurantia]
MQGLHRPPRLPSDPATRPRPVAQPASSSSAAAATPAATAAAPAASPSIPSHDTRSCPSAASQTKPPLGLWTAANASHRSQYLLRPPEHTAGSLPTASASLRPHSLTPSSSSQGSASCANAASTPSAAMEASTLAGAVTGDRGAQRANRHTSVSSRYVVSARVEGQRHAGSSTDDRHDSNGGGLLGNGSIHTLHTSGISSSSSSSSSGGSGGSNAAPSPTVISSTSDTAPSPPTHPATPRRLLNARQISSHISNSHHTSELARILRSHAPHGELDAQHISAMLARVPKLVDLACNQRGNPSASHWPLHARQRMYSAVPDLPPDLSQLLLSLLQAFSTHLSDGAYGVRQLSNIVWVLGKLRMGRHGAELGELESVSAAVVAEAAAALLRGSGQLLRAGGMQDLSNFALGCTYLGMREDGLWHALGELAPAKLQEARLQEVVNLAWCFAQSGVHSVPLFSSIAAHLTRPAAPGTASHAELADRPPPGGLPPPSPPQPQPQQPPPQQQQPHAAPAGTTPAPPSPTPPPAGFPPTDTSRLQPESTPLVLYLNEQQLPNLAWAFAKAGVYNPTLMDLLCTAAVGVIRSVSAQGLSNLAWSLATLRHTHPACLDALVAGIGWKRRGLSGQAISNIAWAMATLRHTPRPLLDTLVGEVWAKTETLKPLGITAVAVACVSANRHEPVLFLRLAQEAVLQLPGFRPATLVRLLWAFAKAGKHYRALLASAACVLAAERSRGGLAALQAEELWALLWTFSVAGAVAAPLSRQTALLPLAHKLLLPQLETLSSARVHSLTLALASAHPLPHPHPLPLHPTHQMQHQLSGSTATQQQLEQQQQQEEQQHPLAPALRAAAPACIRTQPALAVAQLVSALERLGGSSEQVLLAAAQRLNLAPSSTSATDSHTPTSAFHAGKDDAPPGKAAQHQHPRVDNAVAEAATGKKGQSLLLVEPDNWASLVAGIGLGKADLLLAGFADRIRILLGASDVAGMLAEHTLGIVLDSREDEAVKEWIAKLQHSVGNQIFDLGEQSISVTASIGGSLLGEKNANAEMLLNEASQALRLAQSLGGSKVEMHDPAAGEKADDERDRYWLDLLREALDKNGLVLYHQQSISLQDADGDYSEILLRMNGPQGEVLPGFFMPIAKKYKLYPAIDRWVLHRAISALQVRESRGVRTTFFVKLTSASMMDETLLPWLADRLKRAALKNGRIVLEMTESKIMTMLRPAQEFVTAWKKLGGGFALARFGSGLNSFQLLNHIDADFLKIDRSYMAGLPQNEESQKKIAEICEQAKELKLQTVAEWVEDATSTSMLFAYGVDFVQGNFLQIPQRLGPGGNS